MTHSVHSDRKQFFVTVAKTLRKNAFHIVFLFLFMTVALNGYNYMLQMESLYGSSLALFEDFIYCIGTDYADFFAIACTCLVVGLSSVMLALYNFRFMHTKKAVNVYYSLGVRRRTLFAGKVVGCVVSQLIGVALPFLICALYNCRLFGSSELLWQASGYYALCMLSIALYPFAACVFAMTRTGSTMEGLVCGVVLTFAPTMLFYGAYLLSDILLAGTFFDGWFYGRDPDVFVEPTFGGSFHFLDFLYPVTNYDFGDALAGTTLRVYALPSFGYPIVYLAAFAAYSVLAQIAFNRQKTENAGFLAACPRIFAAAIFALGAILIPWCVYLFYDARFVTESAVVFAFFMIAVAFGLFVGIVAILLRSKEKIKAQLPTGGIMAGALAVFVLIFVCGGFGFETRIPDSEKIVRAGITFEVGEGSVSSNEGYSYIGDSKDLYEYNPPVDHAKLFLQSLLYADSWYNSDSFVYFEEAENIERVCQIHGLLLEDARNRHSTNGAAVVISYELANGSSLTRAYPYVPFDVMDEFLPLLNTREYREATARYLESLSANKVTLFSQNLTTQSDVSMCTDDWSKAEYALHKAIVQDVLDGNVPMDCLSDSAPVGYIGMYSYDRENTFQSRVGYLAFYSDYVVIPVYSAMQETLAVLQQYNLTPYFEDMFKPVAAYVYENPLPGLTPIELSDYTYRLGRLQFRGMVYDWNPGMSSETEMTVPDAQIVPPSATFTDGAELLEELAQNAQYTYFINEPGYFVEFVYTDQAPYVINSVAYIPASQMPDALK